MNDKEKLKMLRIFVKPKEVQSDYSKSTIKSVLFGERNNQEVLIECINQAIKMLQKNERELKLWKKNLESIEREKSKRKASIKENSVKAPKQNNIEKLMKYLNEQG